MGKRGGGSRPSQAQPNQRANALNPNNTAHRAAQANQTNAPSKPKATQPSQAQLNLRANQMNPNNVAHAASRSGASAYGGVWSTVTPGHFQACVQSQKAAVKHTNPAPVIERVARQELGSNSHVEQCGSMKKGTNTKHSDYDYHLRTCGDMTRGQRKGFVQRLQQQPEVRTARAKTNAIAVEFMSGAEADVVPKDVTYSAKQNGFQQHKTHYKHPEFAHQALKNAATIARVHFQHQGPCKGYEVDNHIRTIDSKYPKLKEDQTGKALFDKMLAQGPQSVELHNDPKRRGVEKQKRHLEQRYHEVKKVKSLL